VNRRVFLATTMGGLSFSSAAVAQQSDLPEPIRKLRPMLDGVVPIGEAERAARREKARRLMAEHKLDAIYLENGSSMYYFTGKREAGQALVLGAKSRFDAVWTTPDPAQAAQTLRGMGIAAGRVGMEEQVRFATFDGLRKEIPAVECVSGTPAVAGCRMIKSAAEIALLQRANEITIEAYKAALATLREGMTQRELGANISAAFRALGTGGAAMAIFGKYTAFPHGSIQPQQLREGDMVLIDDGCNVEGYQSDITRTTVFGKPTKRQREVWDLERKAQDAALAAARPGATCESVDAAARKVITDAGFGPGYKTPGLPHRTGHGIGLDGHEWTNLVKGNTTRIEPGMCFSNEPTIVIYGEFGVRLEDCMYITPEGARMFTRQSPAIDRPFA
jgi:Xaa-Pro dipeptidase